MKDYRRIDAISKGLGIERDTGRLIWDLTGNLEDFLEMANERIESGGLVLID